MPLTGANATTASVKARRHWVPSGPPAGRQVFLDRNDRFGAGEAPREVGHILLQHGHFRRERIRFRGFRAALDRYQRTESTGVTLAAPVTQRRRVDTLAAQDRTDPPGLGSAVGLGKNAQLVACRKRPPPRTRG